MENSGFVRLIRYHLILGEGFGRNTYKDQKNFYYFSRGSLYESKTCLQKAYRRELLDENTYTELLKEHNILGIKLNNFIKSVEKLMNNEQNKKKKDGNNDSPANN